MFRVKSEVFRQLSQELIVSLQGVNDLLWLPEQHFVGEGLIFYKHC